MPKFNVAVDHQLQRQDVVDRLKNFATAARDNIPVQVTHIEEVWDDEGNLEFSFSAMGFKISGNVIACTQSVTVMGKIPFAALPFRGAIESQISDSLKQAIG